MKDEYRREMERLGPRQEELERLYTMIEGGASMKGRKRLGCRAAAVLVCAALLVTVGAAASVPVIWETLQNHLGVFAPYAKTIDGAVCTDQGIQLQVLSAISDDLEARVYLAVRDVEKDRLNEFLKLSGRLTAGEAKEPEDESVPELMAFSSFSTSCFELVSYDSETKTALLCAEIHYDESVRPNGEAQLSVTGMSTRQGMMYGSVSCASVTGAVLESLPAAEGDTVVFEPSSRGNGEYDNSVLPSEHVVLAPGQTPMDIEGTEDMRVSSMGFASDGCFHIRLDFAEGVAPSTYEPKGMASQLPVHSLLYSDIQYGQGVDYTIRETLVEGGMDILFPLIKAENLEDIRDHEVRVYGTYTRPGLDVEGDWSTQFELDYYPSVTLDWTGELAGWQVQKVTVSPLSITMNSNASGGIHSVVPYALKKDGTTVTAESGTSSYINAGALAGDAEDRWEAHNTWKFVEPVDVEDIVSLTFGDVTIPVN